MPNGLVKKYYEPTEKFHSAKSLHDVARRVGLEELLTDVIRFDEEMPKEAESLLRKIQEIMKIASP